MSSTWKKTTIIRTWTEQEWRDLLGIPAGEKIDHAWLEPYDTGTRARPAPKHKLTIRTTEDTR